MTKIYFLGEILQNLTKELTRSENDKTDANIKLIDQLTKALNGYPEIDDIKLNSAVLNIGNGSLDDIEDVSVIPLFQSEQNDYLVAFLKGLGAYDYLLSLFIIR